MAGGSMRYAMWYGGEDIRLEERPLADPTGDEVVVRVVACGVCATDLHMIDGTVPLYRPPRILGHEVGGVVEAVGPGVRSVRPGDAVALETTVPCDTCYYCREAKPFMCPNRRSIHNGFAEYTTVPERIVYKLPAGVPPEHGALAEPVACVLHAAELAPLQGGSTAAVIGAGPIGLMLIQVIRRLGVTRCFVADLDPARRELALRLGATDAVDPAAENLTERVRAGTDGVGVDLAFEVVGAGKTLEMALELPRRAGTVVMVGVAGGADTATVRPYDLFARELTLRASAMRAYEFRRAAALLPYLDLEPFLTCRVPLDRVMDAVGLARRRAAPKVLVCP